MIKNQAPLLVGQLKAIAHPFYVHLDAAAPVWLAGQRAANGTESGGIFPWTDDPSDDNHHGMANLGQLKAVFSLRFDEILTFDSDGDGLPDWWEIENGLDPEDPADGSADPDGDGLTNEQEYSLGTNPDSFDQIGPVNLGFNEDILDFPVLSFRPEDEDADPYEFPSDLYHQDSVPGREGGEPPWQADIGEHIEIWDETKHPHQPGNPIPYPNPYAELQPHWDSKGIKQEFNMLPGSRYTFILCYKGRYDSYNDSNPFTLKVEGADEVLIDGQPAQSQGSVKEQSFMTDDDVDNQTYADWKYAFVAITADPEATTLVPITLTLVPDDTDQEITYGGFVDLLPVEIIADTNRNGLVDTASDHFGKDAWTKQRGAIYSVNFDRDETDENENTSNGFLMPDAINFSDDGNADYEHYEIVNADDENDITPFKIRAIKGLPQDHKVFLRVDEEESMRAVHIFKKIVTGEKAIWGSYMDPVCAAPTIAPWIGMGVGDVDAADALNLARDISVWINENHPDYEETRDDPANEEYYIFGLEGLVLRGMEVPGGTLDQTSGNPNDAGKFSGEILLHLEIRDAENNVVGSDSIRLRVAPWIAQWNSLVDQERFVMENIWGNGDLITELETPTELQYGETPDQWIQDHVEIGYTQRPGGPITELMFRLPRYKDYDFNGSKDPLPTWPLTKYLGNGKGVFQIGVKNDYAHASTQYGGNLEVLPPNERWPPGRILLGGKQIDGDFRTFLEAQEVQAFEPSHANQEFGIEVDWLRVAHLDEVFAFLDSNRVAIADTAKAIEILKSIPAAEQASTLLFASSQTPTKLGVMPEGAYSGIEIETGVDHRNEEHFKFIRFYEGDLKGTVCEILSHGDGFLTIRRLWQTGKTGILNGDPDSGDINEWDYFTCKNHWAGKFETDGDGNVVLDANGQPIVQHQELPPRFIETQGGSKYVLFGGSRFWGSLGNKVPYELAGEPPVPITDDRGMPAAVTVAELLADQSFVFAHESVLGHFRTALGMCEARLSERNEEPITSVRFPSLFLGNLSQSIMPLEEEPSFLDTYTSEAFIPGAVNLQSTGGENPRFFIPKQFGPIVNGIDLFEEAITTAVSNNENVSFVDVWDGYHRHGGEVHCGTIFRRISPDDKDWWENHPESNQPD